MKDKDIELLNKLIKRYNDSCDYSYRRLYKISKTADNKAMRNMINKLYRCGYRVGNINEELIKLYSKLPQPKSRRNIE